MALTQRMRNATDTLLSRFHRGLSRLPNCVVLVLIDLMRLTCEEDPLPALRSVPGLWSRSNTWIKTSASGHFQAYRRAQWYSDQNSKMRVCVELEPREPWLEPYTISVYADDQTGLVRSNVLSVLEILPPVVLTKLELAIDFALVTQVNRSYVRRNALFGKSRRDISGTNKSGDWWGSRRGGKRVVSYLKDEVAAHRVEFKLRSRFLRHHGINSVFDFSKFAEVIPRRHILFARLDEKKLVEHLRRHGNTGGELSKIINSVRPNTDLWATLNYLRRVVGLKNVRRLLVPLRTNALVSDAMKEFVTKWPATVRRVK